MAQQYTFPSRAGCSVMSVHHSSLGHVTVNCRFTKSAGALTLIRLGTRGPGCGSPYKPCSVMIEHGQFEVDVHVIVGRQGGPDATAPVVPRERWWRI